MITLSLTINDFNCYCTNFRYFSVRAWEQDLEFLLYPIIISYVVPYNIASCNIISSSYNMVSYNTISYNII
jgi:hypothetical protein